MAPRASMRLECIFYTEWTNKAEMDSSDTGETTAHNTSVHRSTLPAEDVNATGYTFYPLYNNRGRGQSLTLTGYTAESALG